MEKKTVVITGSTRGIGYGLAVQFLKRGHQVVLNGRNPEVVAKKVHDLTSQGYDARGIAGDVTEETTHQVLIALALESYKKIDIWINNAGIPQAYQYFEDLNSQQIRDLVSVNIAGLMLGTQAAVRFFKRQGYGKIFNMEGFGSDGRMMDKLTLYGTTKRGVNYFTKSVSREVKENSIQIGILSPGMVRTDFLKNAMSAAETEEQSKNKKVMDILAEDVETVTPFLVEQILKSTKKYDRIEYLTKKRLIPKIVRLMMVK
ncbi:MAG: SDR family oxidoreductase [Bacteroidales bacterium]|nr:SDR family oxidoreductase [Bacteroidales bacterium]